MDCHTSKNIQVREECGKCQAEKAIEKLLQHDKHCDRNLRRQITTMVYGALVSADTCLNTIDRLLDNIKLDARETMGEEAARACRKIYNDHLEYRSNEVLPFVIVLANIGLSIACGPMPTQDLMVLSRKAKVVEEVMPSHVLHQVKLAKDYFGCFHDPLEIFKDEELAYKIIKTLSSLSSSADAEVRELAALLEKGFKK